ncbi:hypothetical protein EV175_005970 [Coemansia sp. RSA 1933]|nr:hypothetical protein EV175_005970 [Coemansia sp. RSA 1933]
MDADKKRHRAAAAVYAAGSSQALSDIGDWRDPDGYAAESCGTWRGHTLRRVRSWGTSTPSRHIPALSTWLGDLGSYVPTMAGLRWPDAAPRRQSTDGCIHHRRSSTDGVDGNRRLCKCPSCSAGVSGGSCADDNAHVACAAPPLPPSDKEARRESTTGSKDSSSTVGSAHKDGEMGMHVYITAEAEVESVRRRRRPLMSVFQIPEYMAEDYIWDAYRPISDSYCECLQSWGYVHSELGNIMTHLVGFVAFFVLALVTGPVIIPRAVGWQQPPGAARIRPSAADYLVVYTYLFAVLLCLAASVAFHTLSCHSRRVHFRSLRCDFIGILTLIVGSVVPIGYYGFVHSRHILIGYMVMFVALGVLGVLVSIFGRVESPRRAFLRPVIFMTISASGLGVPLIHAAVLDGYAGAVSKLSMWYVIAMALLYIAGTLIYAFKLPERYRPGKHNVVLHSHQIFHVLVVAAAVCHYIGIIRALAWVHIVSPAS